MTQLEPLFAEFVMLYLRVTRLFNRRMAEQGASLARTRLLLALQRTKLKRSTELAEFYALAPRTITEAIDGLEREGLVERKPDPNDRRAKLITVTPEGECAAKRTEPLRLAMIEQYFGVLEPEECEQLLYLLKKIGDNLEDCDPIKER